jgi:hypothetical protein
MASSSKIIIFNDPGSSTALVALVALEVVEFFVRLLVSLMAILHPEPVAGKENFSFRPWYHFFPKLDAAASLCRRFLGWQEIIFLIIASINLLNGFFSVLVRR